MAVSPSCISSLDFPGKHEGTLTNVLQRKAPGLGWPFQAVKGAETSAGRPASTQHSGTFVEGKTTTMRQRQREGRYKKPPGEDRGVLDERLLYSHSVVTEGNPKSEKKCKAKSFIKIFSLGFPMEGIGFQYTGRD